MEPLRRVLQAIIHQNQVCTSAVFRARLLKGDVQLHHTSDKSICFRMAGGSVHMPRLDHCILSGWSPSYDLPAQVLWSSLQRFSENSDSRSKRKSAQGPTVLYLKFSAHGQGCVAIAIASVEWQRGQCHSLFPAYPKLSDKHHSKFYKTWAERLVNMSHRWDSTLDRILRSSLGMWTLPPWPFHPAIWKHLSEVWCNQTSPLISSDSEDSWGTHPVLMNVDARPRPYLDEA